MIFRKTLLIFGASIATFLGSPLAAMAADEVTSAAHSGGDGFRSLGAALAISVAAFGGAIGQGKTATAALEGIARNPAAQPKIFVPMIIALALIESLVLYAFVIAFIKI